MSVSTTFKPRCQRKTGSSVSAALTQSLESPKHGTKRTALNAPVSCDGKLRSSHHHRLIMAVSSVDPFLHGTTGRNTRGLLRLIILCAIAAAAVSSRLFSVISMYAAQASRNWLYVPEYLHCEQYGISFVKISANFSFAGFESIIHECPYSSSGKQARSFAVSIVTIPYAPTIN